LGNPSRAARSGRPARLLEDMERVLTDALFAIGTLFPPQTRACKRGGKSDTYQ